mmetsp:Transcript_20062/g.33434  ORF Transcript_20062/g.33434 Transcript_20062/m.33434 type:complete len:209 (+) Transcript_20062:357-983(+)
MHFRFAGPLSFLLSWTPMQYGRSSSKDNTRADKTSLRSKYSYHSPRLFFRTVVVDGSTLSSAGSHFSTPRNVTILCSTGRSKLKSFSCRTFGWSKLSSGTSTCSFGLSKLSELGEIKLRSEGEMRLNELTERGELAERGEDPNRGDVSSENRGDTEATRAFAFCTHSETSIREKWHGTRAQGIREPSAGACRSGGVALLQCMISICNV